MSDPFLIEGPAYISVSGGRTSGYMLWRILQAHGGKLPDDVRPIFANTGKEMGETLDFVDEMALRWKTPITWVEYAGKDAEGKKQHRLVNWHTASRNGEPYEQLIRDRQYLPNPVARFCTVELKIRAMHRVIATWGWEEWTSCIGIRADEPYRVAKLKNPSETENETRIAPLAQSGVAVADVGQFWLKQPFDLRLPNMNGKTMHGNCDLCFLKGADQVYSLILEQPKRAEWWMRMEALALASSPDGALFRKDRPDYATMHRLVTGGHGEMFPIVDDEPLQDCMCVD